MLAIVGLVVVGFFLILWRGGFLDELSQRAQSGDGRFGNSTDGQSQEPAAGEMNRLEVYRGFIDRLSEEDQEM